MPALLPFRAFTDPEQSSIYIPGEEPVPPLPLDRLVQDAEPALFIYRQSFNGSVREGVIGVLDRAARLVALALTARGTATGTTPAREDTAAQESPATPRP